MTFQPYAPHQALLLPPSLQDWLPEDHLVYFISDTVDQLDLKPIIKAYRRCGSGSASYHPAMMLKLLIYAYSSGVFSSRRIEENVRENIAFRILAAGQFPGYRSVARFRKQHIDQFQELFVQVVQIATEAGLVKMGQISIDGTKIKANASKRKAMTYQRMQEDEQRLKKEIAALSKAADHADDLDEEEFGDHFDGQDIPNELTRREKRLGAIKKAKQELEDRKRDEAETQEREDEEKKQAGKPVRHGGKKKSKTPEPKDQASFTDPDSRIMKSSSGFEQAFNAQLAIDNEVQIIVAAEVTQDPNDLKQLLPLLDTATNNTKTKPETLLADAGYLSEDNLEGLDEREVEGFIAIGKKKDRQISDKSPATQRMQRKLKTKRGVREYAKRKHKVEAPIGWIKRCMGFQTFSMRGLVNVSGEFALVCLAMNLKRLTTRMVWAS